MEYIMEVVTWLNDAPGKMALISTVGGSIVTAFIIWRLSWREV